MTDSGAVVRVALWLGLITLVLTLLLAAGIVLARVLLLARRRRQQRFLALWRPLFMQSLEALPARLPALGAGDVFPFLNLWNHLHESLRGAAKDGLNRLARATGIGLAAELMLIYGRRRERLAAVVTLGHLRERAAWPTLEYLARHRDALLSLSAVRALMQIDADAAMPILILAIADRADWPPARVAAILREAGPERVSGPLVAAVVAALDNRDKAVRLIRYLDTAYARDAMPLVHRLLDAGIDEQILSACLKVVVDPRSLDLVRRLLAHPRWHIRVQAARALGRIGDRGDEQRLAEMLEDEQWWVRYRAAQALVRLPFITTDNIAALRAAQSDPYARDMLDQVLAECRLT